MRPVRAPSRCRSRAAPVRRRRFGCPPSGDWWYPASAPVERAPATPSRRRRTRKVERRRRDASRRARSTTRQGQPRMSRPTAWPARQVRHSTRADEPGAPGQPALRCKCPCDQCFARRGQAVSRKGFWVPWVSRAVARIGSWVLVGLLALGTLANFLSQSPWERFLFGPVTLVLARLCFVVARASTAPVTASASRRSWLRRPRAST